jgi:hypothetical protein
MACDHPPPLNAGWQSHLISAQTQAVLTELAVPFVSRRALALDAEVVFQLLVEHVGPGVLSFRIHLNKDGSVGADYGCWWEHRDVLYGPHKGYLSAKHIVRGLTASIRNLRISMCSGALASAHLCEDNLFDCKLGNIHAKTPPTWLASRLTAHIPTSTRLPAFSARDEEKRRTPSLDHPDHETITLLTSSGRSSHCREQAVAGLASH